MHMELTTTVEESTKLTELLRERYPDVQLRISEAAPSPRMLFDPTRRELDVVTIVLTVIATEMAKDIYEYIKAFLSEDQIRVIEEDSEDD